MSVASPKAQSPSGRATVSNAKSFETIDSSSMTLPSPKYSSSVGVVTVPRAISHLTENRPPFVTVDETE